MTDRPSTIIFINKFEHSVRVQHPIHFSSPAYNTNVVASAYLLAGHCRRRPYWKQTDSLLHISPRFAPVDELSIHIAGLPFDKAPIVWTK